MATTIESVTTREQHIAQERTTWQAPDGTYDRRLLWQNRNRFNTEAGRRYLAELEAAQREQAA